MSNQDVKAYVTRLSAFQVVMCRFCETCISLKDLFQHYKRHHTAKKDHYVSMKVRHTIADYMAELNLRQPQDVVLSHGMIPELKIVKEGFICKFPDCCWEMRLCPA